ncbi:protein cereblon [Trifolium pratense]|uniref:Protein cereblon n=1 Tax=Trifolium pratense TaxID=57577 RepID=A0A2K3P7Q8_TRIPR|nr:protein cereblon [Trifolium pratense]
MDDAAANHSNLAVGVEINYDTSVPTVHGYLGDLDDTHHGTPTLNGGDVLVLPLICVTGSSPLFLFLYRIMAMCLLNLSETIPYFE